MAPNPHHLSEQEKYFFDLTGYLVVRGVLSRDQVTACNDAIEHHADRTVFDPAQPGGPPALAGEPRRHLTGMLGWDPAYREPFRDLLVHPVVVGRLNELCGKKFRLDHGPILISAQRGTAGLGLHGGGEPFNASSWYHQQNDRINCRAVTVAWQLVDVNAGDGGFVIVPGSHKSRFAAPDGVKSLQNDLGLVVQPVLSAGDVLFFAEAALHGTRPWTSQRPRRSLLYKYASRDAARYVGRAFTPEQRYGDWTRQLSPEQRSLLYGPGHHSEMERRPALESDGRSVWVVD